MPDESVLAEAQRIMGARQAGYGHPIDNHGTTAEMFSAFLRRKYAELPAGFALDAEDVCWMNVCQKASRDAHEPARDNLTDAAGYVGNIELIYEERARRGRAT